MDKRSDKIYCCPTCAEFDRYVRRLESVIEYVYNDACGKCEQMKKNPAYGRRCLSYRVGEDGRCIFAVEGRCTVWGVIKQIESGVNNG